MKALTIKNLSLQMDLPDTQIKNVEAYAKDMIDLINLTLQREPYGLAAQIINTSSKHIPKSMLSVKEVSL